MFYHELKSRTWIQRENKPYFILNIHELEVHLLQYGLQLEPYEYYFTPDDFPTDLNLLYYQNSM